MAQRHDASFFDRLIAPMLKHLRHIAGLTRGEQSVDDLKSHAWIIAEEIKAERGAEIEPDDEEIQATIVARLHKLFGRFVNRATRFAVRLDQEDRDDDGDFRKNAVLTHLSGPQLEPEVALLAKNAAETARVIHAQFSEAIAYYHVFGQFGGDSAAVARYPPSRLQRSKPGSQEPIPPRATSHPYWWRGKHSTGFQPRRGRWRRQQHAPIRFWRVCGHMRPRRGISSSAMPMCSDNAGHPPTGGNHGSFTERRSIN